MAQNDDTPWLAPDELRDWKWLMALLETLPSALDAQLKRDAGLNTFEYLVLAGLSEAPDRALPLSLLATFAQGSLSRLSHAVSRLEEQGWVVRRPTHQAGRRSEAALTDAGWKKVQETAPGHVREVRRLVIDTLSPDQVRVLGASARKVVATIDPELATALANGPRPV
ncbi:MAG: MarR family transcriptional regulator [Actinobacteria bacterium]|nr:MarR family transcriptional regulator [Actinomycetota bacterium]